MIVWHFLFDLASVGLVPDLLMQSGVMELARYMIAGSFIAISGVCARLSKRPLCRGLIVLAAALLVSAVTYLIGAPAYWGILHLLGVCMLLYAAARRRWEALPGIYACGATLLIFALTFMLPIRVRVGVPRALAWLSRRSLLIYLVHQPVLFALAALLQRAAQGA